MLRAIIFDLDGVLVKFSLDSRKIKEEVVEFLERNGVPHGVLGVTMPFSKIRETAAEQLRMTGRGEAEIRGLMAEAEEILIRHEMDAALKADLLPNVKEALEKIASHGIRLGLFTYNNSRAADLALRKNGIEKFFSAVVARDSVERAKPNPIHLRTVIDRLGVAREEAIVVGDSEMDIKPSKELGVRVIGITTGIKTAEELEAYGPDFIVDDIRKVLEIAGIR
ncbi:MAG: HAD family hydrolase [Candidatus Methanomethylicia archaeon]|nr:HAD family hydrolase [Candidatus Methanomethylicia archaeon]